MFLVSTQLHLVQRLNMRAPIHSVPRMWHGIVLNQMDDLAFTLSLTTT